MLLDSGRFNVAVARTFSKLYGLAGQRIGYGVMKAETAAAVKEYSTGSLNLLGVVAAQASLEDPTYASETVAKIKAGRNALIEGLIQEADDAELMDSYLEGADPGRDYLLDDLMKATSGANLYPVVPVIQSSGLGTEELLSLIEQGFPTPSTHPHPPQRTRRT